MTLPEGAAGLRASDDDASAGAGAWTTPAARLQVTRIHVDTLTPIATALAT